MSLCVQKSALKNDGLKMPIVYFLLERNINGDVEVRSIRVQRNHLIEWFQFEPEQRALHKHEILVQKVPRICWVSEGRVYNRVEVEFYITTEAERSVYFTSAENLKFYQAKSKRSKLLERDPDPLTPGIDYLENAPELIDLKTNNPTSGGPVNGPKKIALPNLSDSRFAAAGQSSSPATQTASINHSVANEQSGSSSFFSSNKTGINEPPVPNNEAANTVELKRFNPKLDDPQDFIERFEELHMDEIKKNKFHQLLHYLPKSMRKFVRAELTDGKHTWFTFVGKFLAKYGDRYQTMVEQMENEMFEPKDEASGLVNFVTRRFKLYDHHHRGVPEEVQVWSTINHVRGDLKRKLFNNRDTRREQFLERCRLIEFGDEDDDESGDDHSDSESEDESRTNRKVSEERKSSNTEKSRSSSAENTSDQPMLPTSNGTGDRGTKRVSMEEEQVEPDVILIEDSDEEMIDMNFFVKDEPRGSPSKVPTKKKRI